MPRSTKSIAANIWKKAQKIILGSLLAGGLLLCTGTLGLSLYVPFLVKKQLEKQVAKSSAQQWQLSIGAVNIYWLRFSFALEGVTLTKSNKLADILPIQDSIGDWRIHINRIECSGISLWSFLRNEALDFLPGQYLKAQTLQWQQGQQSALLEAPTLEGLDWAGYWQQRKLYLQKFSVASVQMAATLAKEGDLPLPDTLEAEVRSLPSL